MFDLTRRDLDLPATRASSRPIRLVDGATVHHTTGPTIAEQLGQTVRDAGEWVRDIYSGHTGTKLDAHGQYAATSPWSNARNYADVAYHVLVHVPTRTVAEGRPLGRVGAHEEAVNRTRLGVAVLGDGEQLDADDAAWLAGVIEELRAEVGSPTSWTVDGHRDHDSTTCPGDGVYAALPALRGEGAPSPTPAPSAPQRPAPRPSGAVAGPHVTPPPFPLPGGHYFARTGDRAHRTGAGVKQAQAQLAERGWIAHAGEVGHPGYIVPDGVFGPQTERVVRGFQKQKGLTVDGLLGPITWRALWREPVT